MLDSLVRVSRRVGGAADLLGREMRTATERCSLYESSHVPVGRRARICVASARLCDQPKVIQSHHKETRVKMVNTRVKTVKTRVDMVKTAYVYG